MANCAEAVTHDPGEQTSAFRRDPFRLLSDAPATPMPRFEASLSLCLPAYNEQDCIIETLAAALAALTPLVISLEVIVVDDGSRDATGDRVRSVAARDARVRLVSHERNRGYGAAVTSGLVAARGDLVMFADSDGQFDFGDAARLLARLEHHDFVVGYRHRRVESLQRRLNAWAWGRLVRLLYGVQIRDLDCAFKLFRREVVERLQLTATGACINAELMCQCRRAGFCFAEVAVGHRPRKSGRSTGSSLTVIARAFRELPYLQTEPLPPPQVKRKAA